MLSDEEKMELLEGAASVSRGEDFRKVRENMLSQPLSPDEFLCFLTSFYRCVDYRPPEPHHPYHISLI